MSYLVENPDCWFSHAEAHLFSSCYTVKFRYVRKNLKFANINFRIFANWLPSGFKILAY